MNNRINYTVGFQTDPSGLQNLKQELASLKQYQLNDLLKIDSSATQADLDKLKQTVSSVEQLLEKSYNFKLDTTNVATFTNELKKSNLSMDELAKGFAIGGEAGKKAFRDMSSSVLLNNNQLKQTHSLLDSMAKTLANTIKWSIASTAINTVTGSIRSAWEFTKKLDSSLNDIRIVTGKSAEEMEAFAKSANNAAKTLGTSTTSYTKAALIYYQQGLNEDDVKARTEATIKAANVTGQSASEVSEQLTAVWNGYKVASDEAESYVDKLAAVAATTAVDLEELSTGMSKVASSANAMGVTIDQLSAQIATIGSVTRQDTAVVGTALKTIFARMGDLEIDGVDEFGVKLGDVSGKMQQMGIQVLDQQGNLRDMGSIIEEVAGKWDGWTAAQQQAAAVALAGKRQYNNLIALFENWDMYESALTTSQASAGTLQKQQDTYMDSLEGHLEQLGAAGEKLYSAIFDSDSMKDMISGVTVLVERFSSFIDAIGGGGALLANFGAIALNVFQKQLAGGISTAINNFMVMGQEYSNIGASIKLILKETSSETVQQDAIEMHKLSMKQDELKYMRIMTQEEKARYNEQIKAVTQAEEELKAAQEEEASLANQLELAKEILATQRLYAQKDAKGTSEEERAAGDQLRNKDIYTEQELKDKHLNGGQFTDSYEFNLENEAGREAAVQAIGKREKELETQQGYADDMDVSLRTKTDNELAGDASAFSDNVDTFVQGYQGNPEDVKALAEANDELALALEEYKNAADGSAEKAKALEAVQKASKEVIKEQNAAVRKQSNELKKIKKPLQDYTKLQEKNRKAIENNRKALAKQKQEYQKMVKQLNTKALVSGITQIGSALLTMASIIPNIMHLSEVWNDEDLTRTEKITQTLEAMLMLIPMVATGIGGLVKGVASFTAIKGSALSAVMALNAEQQKELLLQQAQSGEDVKAIATKMSFITAEQAKSMSIEDVVDSLNEEQVSTVLSSLATNAQSSANVRAAATEKLKGTEGEKAGIKLFFAGLKAQLGFWPLLLIGIAILAVFAAIVAIAHIFSKDTETSLDKANKALEKEKETLAAVNEQYKKMTEELQNVTKAFDDLNEKQKIINDLQVGTEEWTKAVQENNQAILQLLSDYAELSAYIVTDENGVMSVSAEGEEVLEDKLQTQTNRAYAQTLYQQSEVFKADNKVKDLVAGEKISSDNDDIDYAASSGGLKEAFAEAEEQAIRKRASELYSQNYDENNGLDSEGLKADLIQEFGEEAAKVFFDDYGNYEGTYNDYIEDDIRALAGTDYSDDFYYDLQEILQGSATKEGLAEEIAKTFDMEAAASEELANALWEEKDAIYDNVASINTNTDAVERLEAAYAAQFFANNESRLEAESTAAWDALMGDQITKEAEKATGKATDSNDSGKEKDDLNDEAMKNYAASLGVTEDQLEIKDGKVKVKGADDSTAVNLDDAAELANQYAGAVEAEKQSEKITKLVNTAYAAADEVGAGSLINLSGGQRSVALDSSTTTLDDIENLDASKEAIFESLMATGDYANRDEVAKALGYENEASYNAAFQRTKLSAESSVKKLTAGHLNGGAFDASKYGSATMDQAKTIADAFETVFQSAGNKGTEALNAMLDDFSGDPDTQEKIAQIASSIDFTDINAENKFKAALEEANIYVDETSEGWKTMVDSMAEAANVAGSVAHQFSAIRGDLAEIKSLTDGLKFGDVVSDEDYKNLIKFNSAAKDMFIQTADGYEFIGGNGKQLKELLTEGYSDLNNVRNDFNLISDAATNFAGKEDSIKVHNSTAENQKVANDIIATKGYEQLLAAQGVNADNFVNALAIVNDPNADKGSEEYKNAIAVMESGISAVSQSLTDNEAGLFSGDQAVETWVSYNADSWSEAKGMLGDQGYGEDSELYKKFETKWKNTFLSELGFSGSAASMLGADELESHLRTVRQLELDYYQDINAELNLLGASIDRAFGADRLEMLQKQVDLQKESQAIAYDQYADMQQTFTAISTDFLANAATNYGVNASELTNEDGTLDLAALRDLQLNYSTDSAEYEDIENLITMWSQLDDAAVSAAEAAWGVVDAQVESFRYQNEMQAKLRDTQKQWLEFGQKFAGYGEKGLNVFGEQSAADMINTAFENYAASREVLTEDIFTSLSGMNEIADRVTNLSDEYNAAAEVTAAKQAGLDTARSDFSTATDLMATIEEERAKYQAAADAEKAVAAAEERLANAESAIATAEQNKATADADVIAAEGVVEAAKGAVAEKTAKVATVQAEADDAGKKTRDAKQAALATAQNEEAVAKKELETAQAQLANATAAASHAQATLTAAQTAKENAQSELDSVKEANGGKTSAELEQDKQNALKAYADSLRAMGVTVAESGYTFESLSAAYEEAVGKVAEAADRVEGAQQEVLAAQAAQKSIAEEIAANNPYATVGADGTLIWDANAFSEDWEDFLASGQDTLEDMQSQLQSLYDGYIQAQGELMAIYDEEISKLGTINSILQSSAELWKLVGKNATNFSSKLTSYYQSVVTNSEKSYQLASVQLEVAQSEYDKVMALGTEASDEMIKTVTDNLATASENVVSSATEWMTAISESFSASMNAAIDDFVKQATGMDLTGITESWELATAKEERYLDDVNAGYEIDNVERTFQKSIDATDSITAQKKLNSVMQEQLKMLREKDKLSQYDIDRANAMYELTLKQIALEEAQQTANKMKLSRDASGNYTYQYVADQDSIAKAEEELAAAENNLYNMDKDRTKSLVNDYYSTMTEANEAIAAAMAEGDTERVERLKDYYFGANGLLSGVQSELRAAQINLNAIGTDLMGSGWTSSLESFTSAIVDSDLGSLAETVGGIVDETTTTLEGVTTTITSMLSEGSFLSESVNALNNSLKSAGELEAETRELMVATHNVLTELPILTTEIDTLVTQLEGYGEKYQEWLESKIDETETAANTLATESNTEALRDLTNVIKGEGNSSSGESSTGGTGGSGLSQVGGTGVNRNTFSTRAVI